MKNIVIGLVIITFVGGSVYFYINSTKKDVATNNVSSGPSLISPTRLAEINGYVLSIEGNELTIANEIGKKEVTEEEKAARQKLSQEERQALKAQESEGLTKETVILIIPVGTPLVKGSGAGNGENITANLDEIQKGVYVSIWKSGDQIEFAKLKGTSSE